MEVSGQLHAPATLSPGKEPLVPIGWEAGWAPEPFWMWRFREKFPAPTGRTLYLSIFQYRVHLMRDKGKTFYASTQYICVVNCLSTLDLCLQ
jgi:hypothetical protein